MSWNDLRATRATRPGFAADSGVRARLYGAAMEQAEQLFTAASNVGVATSPLLLFYGTAQLARAVVAASPKVRNDQVAVNSHGAQIDGLGPTVPLLLDLKVRRNVGAADRQSSLTSLAIALEACAIEKPVALMDLTSSVPVGHGFLRHHTRRVSERSDPPTPMSVNQDAGPGTTWGSKDVFYLSVGPLPSWLVPEGIGTPLDQPVLPSGETVRQVLGAHLDRFPTLSGWTLPQVPRRCRCFRMGMVSRCASRSLARRKSRLTGYLFASHGPTTGQGWCSRVAMVAGARRILRYLGGRSCWRFRRWRVITPSVG